MRKLIVRVLFPVLVAVGAALTVSTPAHAAKPIPLDYMSASEVASLCDQLGGRFDVVGDDYWCVLSTGTVLICYASIKQCVWHTESAPWTTSRDSAVQGDLVLRDPPSTWRAVDEATYIRSVLSRI
ncbi:hypothetical protein [Asanoa iriomotensis]|uniref:Secreted protein n=1 Tax=Asanoa iriomotensis TaxID=234613 RepID=A0ABQ4C1Q5_9ACTN|nr:hypothetical protein [Asanoa iriomotensis]GIF56697.1 hypothetical protein Air01nite_27920 [Asanoa iriomotensis]